jgi:type I restriction enzyme S subunit
LKEQKAAIINRAVTRGLNPDAPLKPSGIDWLGDIPTHWELRRLRFLLRYIDQGKSPQSEGGLADENSWGVLKAGCVNNGVFNELEHKRLPTNFEVDLNMQVRLGDVLMSRASGSADLVGSVARVKSINYRLILSDKTFRLHFQDSDLTDFFVLVLNSYYARTQIKNVLSGAEGLPNNLPLSEIKNLFVVLPHPSEAIQMTSYIASIEKEVQSAILTVEGEIRLMEEYRSSMIDAAVTGKIDCRNAVAVAF